MLVTVLKYYVIKAESLTSSQINVLFKYLKHLVDSSSLMAIFSLSLLILTYFLQCEILMLTQRLQGVAWSIFQLPSEGQARHVPTGIFLRCIALDYSSS